MLSRDEIVRLADAARIALSEEEIAGCAAALDSLIGYTKAVGAVDAPECELPNISGLSNVLRADEVTPYEDRDALLQSCGADGDGGFLIPRHRMQ